MLLQRFLCFLEKKKQTSGVAWSSISRCSGRASRPRERSPLADVGRIRRRDRSLPVFGAAKRYILASIPSSENTCYHHHRGTRLFFSVWWMCVNKGNKACVSPWCAFRVLPQSWIFFLTCVLGKAHPPPPHSVFSPCLEQCQKTFMRGSSRILAMVICRRKKRGVLKQSDALHGPCITSQCTHHNMVQVYMCLPRLARWVQMQSAVHARGSSYITPYTLYTSVLGVPNRDVFYNCTKKRNGAMNAKRIGKSLHLGTVEYMCSWNSRRECE